jgi:hypothetical protein
MAILNHESRVDIIKKQYSLEIFEWENYKTTSYHLEFGIHPISHFPANAHSHPILLQNYHNVQMHTPYSSILFRV